MVADAESCTRAFRCRAARGAPWPYTRTPQGLIPTRAAHHARPPRSAPRGGAFSEGLQAVWRNPCRSHVIAQPSRNSPAAPPARARSSLGRARQGTPWGCHGHSAATLAPAEARVAAAGAKKSEPFCVLCVSHNRPRSVCAGRPPEMPRPCVSRGARAPGKGVCSLCTPSSPCGPGIARVAARIRGQSPWPNRPGSTFDLSGDHTTEPVACQPPSAHTPDMGGRSARLLRHVVELFIGHLAARAERARCACRQ